MMCVGRTNVVERPVIFCCRSKGRGFKRIHTKLVAASGRDVYTVESPKHWVCESDGGRRGPTDLFKTRKPPSDVVDAVLQVLNEERFSSTKYVASQLRISRKVAKRTLIDSLGMEKFSLRPGFHAFAVEQKLEKVADWRRLFKALRILLVL
jgi:hypothetical protein